MPFTTIDVPPGSSILSPSDEPSLSHTATFSIISHSPSPSTTLTSPAASTPLLQTTRSAATPTDSAVAVPASDSLPQSTKLALDIALPICVIAVIITPLSFLFKRRRERKAAAAEEEAKTVSAREQDPASDVSPLDYASLGHAPRALEGPRRYEWERCGELPLNVRKARGELMGDIAAQELGG